MSNTIRVMPIESYSLLGTQLKIEAGKIYTALIAFNQPDYEEEGKVFVNEILLDKTMYRVVKTFEIINDDTGEVEKIEAGSLIEALEKSET